MACPACSRPNDETFKFCQQRGYKRRGFHDLPRPVKKLKFAVDESAIDERLATLFETRQSSPYVKQKVALESELGAFLAALKTPRTFSLVVLRRS